MGKADDFTPPDETRVLLHEALADGLLRRNDSRLFGECRRCGGGPTFTSAITGLTWAICEPCGEKWPVLEAGPSVWRDAPRILAAVMRDGPTVDAGDENDDTTTEEQKAMRTKTVAAIDPGIQVDTAIAVVEGFPVGDTRFSTAFTQARDAAASVEAAAVGAVEGGLLPLPEVELRELDLFLRSVDPFESLIVPAVDFHRAALDAGNIGLAFAIRSRLPRLIEARARLEPNTTEPARARFLRRCAADLHARGLEPAIDAEIVAVRGPEWRQRLAAVASRHAEHAKAEAERDEREAAAAAAQREADARAATLAEWSSNLEAERTRDPEMRTRREGLARFYRRHGRFTFPIAGLGRMSGVEAAAAVEQGAPFLPLYQAQTLGEMTSSRSR